MGLVAQVAYFKPFGVNLAQLEEIHLAVEEVEATRLKDIKGLKQEEYAHMMNIPRTVFARVLSSARQKVTDALLNCTVIKLEGGNFETSARRFICVNGHEWHMPFDAMINEPAQLCPTCNTPTIIPI